MHLGIPRALAYRSVYLADLSPISELDHSQLIALLPALTVTDYIESHRFGSAASLDCLRARSHPSSLPV